MSISPDQANAELRRKVEVAWSVADRAAVYGAQGFLDHVVIDSRPEPKRYAELAEGWQWSIARKVFPALEAVAKIPHAKNYAGPRSFWFTLPRGHDKTSLIGRLCGWTLGYARHRVSAIAAAADRDQANLLLEFMQAEANLNPWYKKRLAFKNYQANGAYNSKLQVLASDAYSAYGLKPDLMVCDEITHWSSRELWDSVMTGREKRPGSVFIVITNAGTVGSWQWDLLKAAQSNPSWYVYEAPGPLASWMTQAKLDEQKSFVPLSVFRRVHMNEWLDPGEDCGFLTKEEIAQCAAYGESLDWHRQEGGKAGTQYVASIDYGPVKDRTVAVVTHQEGDLIFVDKMDVWQGSREERVQVSEVEGWMSKVLRDFGRVEFVMDQYQMESTIQKFDPRAVVERFEPRGGKSNYEMAQVLRSLVVDRRLIWYKGAGELVVRRRDGSTGMHSFEDELAELVIRPMSYGYRFDHNPNRHDDRAVAVGMAAWRLVKAPRRKSITSGDVFW